VPQAQCDPLPLRERVAREARRVRGCRWNRTTVPFRAITCATPRQCATSRLTLKRSSGACCDRDSSIRSSSGVRCRSLTTSSTSRATRSGSLSKSMAVSMPTTQRMSNATGDSRRLAIASCDFGTTTFSAIRTAFWKPSSRSFRRVRRSDPSPRRCAATLSLKGRGLHRVCRAARAYFTNLFPVIRSRFL